MNADEIYSKNYLAAADLKGGQYRLQIAAVTAENMSIDKSKEEIKLVLRFASAKKRMALNISNKNILKDALGPETDFWIGHFVTIGVMKKQYRDKLVDGLVVLKVERANPPATTTTNGDATNAQPPATL